MNFRKTSGVGTIMEAPLDIIWNLLMTPSGWRNFHPLRIQSACPSGHIMTGQKLVCQMRFYYLPVHFEVKCVGVDEGKHMLALDIHLPANILLKKEIECAPLDENRCMVKSRSDLIYSTGWKGIVTAAVCGRSLKAKSSEWLALLKNKARQTHVKIT